MPFVRNQQTGAIEFVPDQPPMMPGMGMGQNFPMPPQAPQTPPQMPQGNPMMGGQAIQMPEIQMSDADRQQALKMALFNAGTNILSNMGPSRMPVSGAQILGQAGQAGMQGYQQSKAGALDRYKTLATIQKAQGMGANPSDTILYSMLMESGDPALMERAKRMIAYRRAQPPEAYDVKLAKRNAEINTAAPLQQAGETGKQIGEHNMKQYETASGAVENVAKIDELIKHLKTSEAITGMGAETLKNIERARAWFGSESATRRVTDTEVLDVMMGSEVFPLIKSLGVGARGMDTPAEREFMRQVLTGSIELNKQTLIKMAEIRKNVAQRAIERWNARVKKGELNNFFKHTGITRQEFNYGSPTDTGSGRVEVVSPSGKRGTIPESQLQEALRQGYRRL